jgi:hypothetical protein
MRLIAAIRNAAPSLLAEVSRSRAVIAEFETVAHGLPYSVSQLIAGAVRMIELGPDVVQAFVESAAVARGEGK